MSLVEWTRPKQTLSQQRLNASNTTNSCWRQWTRTQLGLHGSVFTTIPHLVLCNVNFFLPLKAFLRSKEAGCQTLDMRATIVMFGGLLREVKNHPGSLHQSLHTYTIAIYLRKPCKKKVKKFLNKKAASEQTTTCRVSKMHQHQLNCHSPSKGEILNSFLVAKSIQPIKPVQCRPWFYQQSNLPLIITDMEEIFPRVYSCAAFYNPSW